MHPFTSLYTTKVIPALQAKFNYSSPYLVPKVQKVVINVGVGDIATDDAKLKQLEKNLMMITGQKAVPTKARIAVSGFKIRKGMVVGYKTTLRGARMNDFIMKLSSIALPRSRDFRGLPETAVVASGSLHIGIKDSMIFPEVAQENFSYPLQVSLVSSTKTLEEARAFYEALGFVFQSK